MSEKTPDETPENNDSLKAFMDKVFGKKEDSEAFFEQMESNATDHPLSALWIEFHEFYKGMLQGGFTKEEALTLLAKLIYAMILEHNQEN